MKSSASSRRRAGFTLIEVMTVIAIMALLGAMGFAGFKFAIRKSKEKQTLNRIAAFSSIIKQYQGENGNYPIPADPLSTGRLRGKQWPVGGAVALYQILAGDGDDALAGSKGKESAGIPGGVDNTGKVLLDTCVAPSQKQIQEKKKGEMVDALEDGRFVVVDGFGHPFQYLVAIRDRNGRITNSGDMHSGSDFEIWSYGTLEQRDDTPQGQAEWVTSWQ